MTADRSPLQPLEPLQEAEIGELLASAGPRPEVPAEDLAQIRAAARGEWKKVVAEEGARPRRRHYSPFLLRAAAVILALGALWWWRSATAPGDREPLATVRRLQGEARAEGVVGKAVSGRSQLAEGDALAAGALVVTGGGVRGNETSPGRLALQLPSGATIRLDEGTTVRLVSATRLELRSGAVYLDSGIPRSGGSALTVETPFGTVSEIGTQFEVRLAQGEGPALRVRVREGSVAVRHGAGSGTVAAGGELTLGRDGRVGQGAIDAHGPAWSWVQAAAPSFEVEGARLGDYLAWVSRETGLRLRYEDQGLEALVPTVVLHGTIEGMAPAESLDAVLPGSGLAFRIEDGTLRVTR
jgi:ferric-dicitrate binding protein FerR (iron transport regulator)